MFETQFRNVAVFKDTQAFYRTDPVLIRAVEASCRGTEFFRADAYPDLGPAAPEGAARGGQIRLDNARTLEAAMKLHKEFPDKKIAVLNFASANNPGGGVKRGSGAQEEALCRCSTLYPALDQRMLWDQYYDVNRDAGNSLYTDALIYSPGVMICKTDNSDPQRLPQEDFVAVDVITCAAPNLRFQDAPPDIYEIHLSRARHIFHIAAYKKVDILVLGAFGCGAFRNDPAIVSRAWREAQTAYRNRFDVIEYAIPRNASNSENYDAFRETMQPLLREDPSGSAGKEA
nr:TIGR02452 family protein [Lachnospiraceae bacterium]